uniref:Uncharacterized protein n=1 Tax=Arundo donax TaxID=35708 RepID=A0A0A9BDV3_ARUDO
MEAPSASGTCDKPTIIRTTSQMTLTPWIINGIYHRVHQRLMQQGLTQALEHTLIL